MRSAPFADWPCSVARTLSLVGDRWTPMILREAYYGTARFDDFHHRLQIARNTLSDRLEHLVNDGLLARREYQRDPVRHHYLLTAMGRDFYPVLLAMARWGDTWLAGESGPPLEYRHTSCDHTTHAEVVCSHCHAPLALDDVTVRRGPGHPQHSTSCGTA